MQIICLKWGDKYDSAWVNRLYTMVEMNTQIPFTFVCLTEDPTGILSEIKIEPLPLEYNLKTWWWKLTLFEKPRNDTCIFIDLDVVIQNDITHWLDLAEKNKLCVIKTYWKSHISLEDDHYLNSSVMIWNSDLSSIWLDFVKHKDLYMSKYRGIDSTLFYHHFNKLKWIPEGEVYSRLYGIDSTRYKLNDYESDTTPEQMREYFFFDPQYTMCIFNGYKRKKLLGPKGEKKYGVHYMGDESFELFKKLGYF